MSVVFPWDEGDFDVLLETCEKDEVTPYMFEYLPKTGKVVEAGCGLGRYAAYLADKGYDIVGIELSGDAVRVVKRRNPELRLIQGDVLRLPFRTASIDGIISLGVIEHFIEGCDGPLTEMHRVLKDSGRAIITVPCVNWVRRMKNLLYVHELRHYMNPIRVAKRWNRLRRVFGKRALPKSPYNRKSSSPYEIYPVFGDFFEYRLKRVEFEDALRQAGFTILQSVPVAHLDGLLHDFGRFFVRFDHWRLRRSMLGTAANALLSRVPFCHNHMHLCVVTKR
jgi:SAM-dependent methyltransferase